MAKVRAGITISVDGFITGAVNFLQSRGRRPQGNGVERRLAGGSAA